MRAYQINKTTRLEIERFQVRLLQLDPIIEPEVAVGVIHLRPADLDKLKEIIESEERIERSDLLRGKAS